MTTPTPTASTLYASCLNRIPFTNTISSSLLHPRVQTHGTTTLKSNSHLSRLSLPLFKRVWQRTTHIQLSLVKYPAQRQGTINVACHSKTPLEATNMHHVATCRIRMKPTMSMAQHTVSTEIPQPSMPTELQHISTSLAHAAVDQIAAGPCAVNIIDSVFYVFIIALFNVGTVLLGLHPTT